MDSGLFVTGCITFRRAPPQKLPGVAKYTTKKRTEDGGSQPERWAHRSINDSHKNLGILQGDGNLEAPWKSATPNIREEAIPEDMAEGKERDVASKHLHPGTPAG